MSKDLDIDLETLAEQYPDAAKKFLALKEALDKYLDDYVENSIIINDIKDILHSRSDEAYKEYTKLNQLKAKLSTD